MKKYFLGCLLLLLISGPAIVTSQIGGIGTYQFLNLPTSSRLTATAGYMPAIADHDIMQGLQNPALINAQMQGQLSVQHRFHLADISHSHVGYGLSIDTSMTVMINLQYLNYGEFIRADELGNKGEAFNGGETAITIGTSHRIDDRLRVGTNLKWVSSNLDAYRSTGLGGDIGLYYANSTKRQYWVLVLKNIGGQLSNDGIQKFSFPIDFQIGYAKRLEHLPFRYSITAHDIQRWRLTYDSELNGDRVINNSSNSSDNGSVIDNFFRHIAFSGELLLGAKEGFILRFGYDHQRNKELSVGGYRSFSGFSMGVGIKMKRFQFDYGFGRFHLAGSSHHLGVRFDMNRFFSKI